MQEKMAVMHLHWHLFLYNAFHLSAAVVIYSLIWGKNSISINLSTIISQELPHRLGSYNLLCEKHAYTHTSHIVMPV